MSDPYLRPPPVNSLSLDSFPTEDYDSSPLLSTNSYRECLPFWLHSAAKRLKNHFFIASTASR